MNVTKRESQCNVGLFQIENQMIDSEMCINYLSG